MADEANKHDFITRKFLDLGPNCMSTGFPKRSGWHSTGVSSKIVKYITGINIILYRLDLWIKFLEIRCFSSFLLTKTKQKKIMREWKILLQPWVNSLKFVDFHNEFLAWRFISMGICRWKCCCYNSITPNLPYDRRASSDRFWLQGSHCSKNLRRQSSSNRSLHASSNYFYPWKLPRKHNNSIQSGINEIHE